MRLLTLYIPILKGLRWEFSALAHLYPATEHRILPLFHLIHDQSRSVVPTFLKHLDHQPLEPGSALDIAVECHAPLTHQLRDLVHTPLFHISQRCLAGDMPRVIPVLRPDSPAPTVAAARHAAAQHRRGICVRVALHQMEANPHHTVDHVRDLLERAGQRPHNVRLIIDVGAVSGETTLTTHTTLVVKAVQALSETDWQLLAVSSGAFPHPVELAELPRRQPHPYLRYDASLWRRVTSELPDSRLDFSDYGVVHPHRPPAAPSSAPDPFLAYTVGEQWQVRIYDRRLPGNDDFMTLCSELTQSPDWPTAGARTSWGDEELLSCARRTRGSGRAGGPSQWLAWATSHHMETVVQRLNRIGRP
ncbi:hypothetical protein O7599_21265 [Streptomyces sp. WMMC500]|uniref:beta family protein n=1 Tax=Streptomyces sp. WMMC500 TaxID=3015154 RepID=UPI00248BFF52|nr:hypothetical protein [Streptomyces sp. WMMC500]WBB58175.1 hypothetical protein O7599_21265 [Streptomyces sp. WMMC500]